MATRFDDNPLCTYLRNRRTRFDPAGLGLSSTRAARPACAALVKTLTWDVLAWNRAAATVLTDFGALPPDQRNILRFIFNDPEVRAAQQDWEGVARFVVGGA